MDRSADILKTYVYEIIQSLQFVSLSQTLRQLVAPFLVSFHTFPHGLAVDTIQKHFLLFLISTLPLFVFFLSLSVILCCCSR